MIAVIVGTVIGDARGIMVMAKRLLYSTCTCLLPFSYTHYTKEIGKKVPCYYSGI